MSGRIQEARLTIFPGERHMVDCQRIAEILQTLAAVAASSH
jgi:RNA polymerase-binding transcription factor DksA